MLYATNWGVYELGMREPETITLGDLRTLQVRSRRATDLDVLRARHCPNLGPTLRTPGMDFQYRAWVTRDDWDGAVVSMARSVNYVKFKKDAEDEKLHTALCAMWSALLRIFPTGSIYDHTGRYLPRTRPVVVETTTTIKRTDEWSIDWGSQADLEDDPAWDDDLSSPKTRASGQLDHSDCGHAATKGARRRCRRRWLSRV